MSSVDEANDTDSATTTGPTSTTGAAAGSDGDESSNSSNSSSNNSSSGEVAEEEGASTTTTTTTTSNLNSTSSRLAVCDFGTQGPVAAGEYLPLCFFLSTSPPRKMVFRVKVEDYAELVLKGSQSKAIAASNFPLHTWVAVSGGTNSTSPPLDCSSSTDISRRGHLVSCPQVYATEDQLVHILNLVINLEDGFVTAFAWDNSCAGCGPKSCVSSPKSIDLSSGEQHPEALSEACGAEVTGCTSSDAGCNMKVFVTWAGTDREGRFCTSAGMRMSKFTGYTLTSLYEKVNQNYESIVG